MNTTVFACLADTATQFGARPFLHLVSDTAARYGVAAGSITYAEALTHIAAASGWYTSIGVRSGQRVALGLDNRPQFFFHWLALNALGVSVVPLNPQWQSAELEYVLDHAEVVLAVVLEPYLTRVGAAAAATTGCPVEPCPQLSPLHAVRVETVGQLASECALLYTSGTTGRPKGCILSNDYFICCGDWYKSLGGYCRLQPGADRLITPLPMYHMNAMATSSMAMIMTGGCIVPLDRFHPTTWWASVAECQATIMHYLGVMPAMLMNLEPGPADTAHAIRFGFGAGLSGELHTAFEQRFGIALIEAWAMTETGCTVAVIASEEPRKVGTACFGRPPAHLDYRLVDEAGRDVANGAPGELLVRRRGTDPRKGFFSGYLKDADATREAWRDEYFHTGDLVYVDADGLMHFVDRKKNVIRRSGENISAVEVEEVLMEIPGVQAAGVAAVADEIRGDEVFACIVANAPGDELTERIFQHCLTRLAYFKAPGYVAYVERLPLTATEKIQRAALKELAASLVGNDACADLRNRKLHRG